MKCVRLVPLFPVLWNACVVERWNGPDRGVPGPGGGRWLGDWPIYIYILLPCSVLPIWEKFSSGSHNWWIERKFLHKHSSIFVIFYS